MLDAETLTDAEVARRYLIDAENRVELPTVALTRQGRELALAQAFALISIAESLEKLAERA